MADYVWKKENKNIVLFIHGFTSDNETWTNSNGISFPEMLLRDQAIADNFDIAFVSYYTRLMDFYKIKTGTNLLNTIFGKVAKIAKKNVDVSELADLVYSHIYLNFDSYENIVVVAHSMGGLIAKACILKDIRINGSNGKIKMFLSLAVPHYGTSWAAIGKGLAKNDQIIDLSPLSKALDELNRQWINPNISSELPQTVYYYGQYDSVVPRTSAVPYHADETSIVTCDDDHFSISKPLDQNKNVFVGVKKNLSGLADAILVADRLQVQKFRDEGQLDNEHFVIKLLIADVHRVLIKDAKETFFNAEYVTRSLIAQGANVAKLESLYRKINHLYTLAFGDLLTGKIKDSNDLVNTIHKQIKEEDHFSLKSALGNIDEFQKTGMLHQLANDLDEDIWWALNHSVNDISEFRKVRGYE